MPTTDPRFWLRFESGEREGERVSLAEGTHTVGRLASNAIVIQHGSVSGRHGRFEVEADGVLLLDLGSTNGIRVDGERVQERRLAHGDRIELGRVAIVFEDRRFETGASASPASVGSDTTNLDELELDEPGLEEAPFASARPLPAAAPPAPAPAPGSDDSVREPLPARDAAPSLESVGAAAMARSAAGASSEGAGSRGTRTPILLGAALLLVLAFAGWRFGLFGALGVGGPGEDRASVTVVPEVPGNLLANASFEDAGVPVWRSAEGSHTAFDVGRAHARRGAVGLGVELRGGDAIERALARSEAFDLPPRRGVELRAWLAVEGQARGRVGLELLGGETPGLIAWAPASEAADFHEVVLAFDTLADFPRGRVVVAGLAEGAQGARVSLDDVSVVLGPATGASDATFEEYELRVLGSPGCTAALLRSGRLLIRSFALSRWDERGFAGRGLQHWSAETRDHGLALVASAADPGAWLEVRTLGQRVLEREDSSEPIVMTMGPDGYREHGLAFERAAATDLLVGGGINLVRMAFGEPTRVSSAPELPETRADGDVASEGAEAGARLRIDFGGRRELALQLDFRAERAAAITLAAAARDAERDATPGEALALWTRLLDEHPYESGLVDEAEQRRSSLEQAGLEELEALRRELERADFFRLEGLYRKTLARAEDVAARYAGSDTQRECTALAETLRARLADLNAGGPHGRPARAARLAGVLEALGGENLPLLRERVEAELAALRTAEGEGGSR